ncbi:MAG: WYL domain-containing protein [Candidatus Gastranaerophilales bacterium]|nr:WYL domain-containing protein [Candidatus Gastranaerophilales bacterium]
MKQDFLENFSVLQDVEIQEHAIYKRMEKVHTLIRYGQREAVPNALRKVYECLLYRCYEADSHDYPLKYFNDNSNNPINISATTNQYFENAPKDFKLQVIRPFLNFVNAGSHTEDVSYANIKDSEIKENIQRLIKIVNWFLSAVKNKKKFQLETKFLLPKAENIDNLKAIINDLKKQNELLRSELKQVKKENWELITQTDKNETDEPSEVFEETNEGSVNLDELEKDIFDTVNFFNLENIYCTHRTIAFFLFGLRINQTDFKDLSKEINFGKYQNNKFTEYEYNTAINELLIKEKIFLNGHFFNTRDYSIISNEELSKEMGMQIVDRDTEMLSADENIIITLQEALEQNKDIEFVYYKTLPNLNKASVTNRHCRPIAILPKGDEPYYYLKAKDGDIEKHFKLDSIQNLKIVD